MPTRTSAPRSSTIRSGRLRRDEAAAEEPQPGMPLALVTADPPVRRALLVMQQSIDAPLSIGRVAVRLGVSRRKLERHFRASLGMTPSEADRLIRVEGGRVSER